MPTLTVPETPPVREGEVLDGKYRVERVLGVGGMGVVVAATHVQLQTRVALKFLLPPVLGHPQVVHRFAREARAAVQIQSEHVARVIDVGTLPTGSPYMVMEYLEGGDLSETVAKGPLPVTKAVGYLLEACEAIAEAHALGIVHRDLKPANLFLARRAGRDPIVKVLDFGISKSNEATTSGLTQTSNVLGSPQYMSPEQMMSSKDVDVRADIWALGVILYELVTGAPPFVAETMAEIVYMVTQRDAPPLLERRPDLPPALGAVLTRALSRDPAGRFADVAELAAALAPFGPPRSEISLERIARVLGMSQVPAAPPPDPAPAAALAETGIPDEPRRSRKVGVLVAAGLAALALAVVGWRALESSAPPPSTAMGPPPSERAVVTAPAPPPPAAPQPAPVVAAPAPPPPAPPRPAPLVVKPPAAKEPPAEESTAAKKPAQAARASAKRGKAHASAAAPAAAAPAPPPPERASRGLNMGMKE
jgi:eukaryotic-like serine/threonine-protein kinase